MTDAPNTTRPMKAVDEAFRLAREQSGTLKEALRPRSEPDCWGDRRDQWSDSIDKAHPVNSGAHDAYLIAMEMVGNRNSKAELVNLVCWLLQGQPK